MLKKIFVHFLFLFCTMTLFSQRAEIIKENGKYGLFDKNHGIVLAPDCDSIMTNLGDWRWNGMFFILKKDNKYAYAYFRNLDSLAKLGYLTPHWTISEYLFDELKVFPFDITIQYKIDNQYGLLYLVTHLDCGTGIWTICSVDGLGELNKTDAIYDKPFDFNDKDRILHVYSSESGGYQLLEFVEYADGYMKWKNYTYDEVFDSIVLYPEDPDYAKEYIRSVKINGKWGLIKINPDSNSVEYIIPCINESPEDIGTRTYEVFYTKKAINDTILIVHIKNNFQLKLNLPTDGDLEARVVYLQFNSTLNSYEEEDKKCYIMLGLHDSTPIYNMYKAIMIIDHNGNIKATYNDPKAEYMTHRNNWGFLISRKTTNGIQWIYDFFDLETGEIEFTITTDQDAIIGNCNVRTPKVPLVIVVSGKENKMIGYYDYSTRKYYKKPPPKDERCRGF